MVGCMEGAGKRNFDLPQGQINVGYAVRSGKRALFCRLRKYIESTVDEQPPKNCIFFKIMMLCQ
ncbi:MAG: hypothetical protein WBP63_18140, partial [Silvibacterium sp.]